MEIITKPKQNHGYMAYDVETRNTETFSLTPIMKYDPVLGKSKPTGKYKKVYQIKETILRCQYIDYHSDEVKQIGFITNQHKSASMQFKDFLFAQSQQKKYYQIVAHNGGKFDHYFVLDAMTVEEIEMCNIKLKGLTIMSMMLYGNEFKDTCLFMPFSLDYICSAFNIEACKKTKFIYQNKEMSNTEICFYKPELKFWEFMSLQNSEPKYWEIYTDYCQYDCISLLQIWMKFVETTNKLLANICTEVNVANCLTIGAVSKKVFKKTLFEQVSGEKYLRRTKAYTLYLSFFYHWDELKRSTKVLGKPRINMDVYNFVRKCIRGGISHCNRPGKYDPQISSYDIASQYPTAMKYMKIPVGASTHVNKFMPGMHGYYHLKNVTFFSRSPCFRPVAQVFNSGVLNWKSSTVIEDLYTDSFMMEYLQNTCGLKNFEVVEGYVSRSFIYGHQLLGKYVDGLYPEKQRQDKLAKDKSPDYNPVIREVVKLFLNSLSGKFAENQAKHFSLQSIPEFDSYPTILINNVGHAKIMSVNNENEFIGLAVMIYSYSKRLLFEYISQLPHESNDVIIVETDSIYFPSMYDQKFIENIGKYIPNKDYPIKIGADLGNIKHEHTTTSGHASYFLGKKISYMHDEKGRKPIITKWKGVPSKTITQFGTFDTILNLEMYEKAYALNEGEKIEISFSTLKKELFPQPSITSSYMTRNVSGSGGYVYYSNDNIETLFNERVKPTIEPEPEKTKVKSIEPPVYNVDNLGTNEQKRYTPYIKYEYLQFVNVDEIKLEGDEEIKFDNENYINNGEAVDDDVDFSTGDENNIINECNIVDDVTIIIK